MLPITLKRPQQIQDYLEGVTTSAGAADKLVGAFPRAAFADFAAGIALGTGGFATDTAMIFGAATWATDTLALAELTLAAAGAGAGAGAGDFALAVVGAGAGAGAGDFAWAALTGETLVEVSA